MLTLSLQSVVLTSETVVPDVSATIRTILAGQLPGDQLIGERLVGADIENWISTLEQLADAQQPLLVLTVGGIGPTGVVPDATSLVCPKLFPGFGTLLRQANLKPGSPEALLWRNTAGLRHQTLVVNLPAEAEAIRIGLPLLFPGIPNAVRLARPKGSG